MKEEIERKFRVDVPKLIEFYGSQRPAPIDMTQGYLAMEPNVVRVRVEHNHFDGIKLAELTIKGKGLIKRPEYPYKIPLDEAGELLTMCPHTITKVRYMTYAGVTADGFRRIWDVDEFKGAHDGLWIAEVELESVNEEFERPAWLGEEVTDDRRYQNVYLAQHSDRFWEQQAA